MTEPILPPNSQSAQPPVKSFGDGPRSVDHASRLIIAVIALVSIAALVGVLLLWQKQGLIQEQIMKQNGYAQQSSGEALLLAKTAQTQALDAQAKTALYGAQINQLLAQRTQMEELAQNLNRSRSQNLAESLSAGLHMAYQQAQWTDNATILLGALNSAKKRLTERADPRFVPAIRSITSDIDRIKSINFLDLNAALLQFDMAMNLVNSLPLANGAMFRMESVPAADKKTHAASKGKEKKVPDEQGWQSMLNHAYQDFWSQIQTLVRIRKLSSQDSALLTPDQSFYLKENLKLRLLNARLSLLTHQVASARMDVSAAITDINRYCDMSAAKTKTMLSLLEQLQYRLQAESLPSIDNTIAALNSAASR